MFLPDTLDEFRVVVLANSPVEPVALTTFTLCGVTCEWDGVGGNVNVAIVPGNIPSSLYNMQLAILAEPGATMPLNLDKVTVCGVPVEFYTQGNTPFSRDLGGVDPELDNLEDAINTLGTTSVVALATGMGYLVIANANFPGGAPTVGVGTNTPLAVTVTGGATATWDAANLNETGNEPAKYESQGMVTVGAAKAAAMAAGGMTMIGVASFIPGAKSVLTVQVFDSSGVLKAIDGTWEFHDNYFSYTGGVTNPVENDIIYWRVTQ